jgi:PAS domain S-box-containing protein
MTAPDFSHFTPHGFCLAWEPGLIWLQAGSDLLIAAAYFSIPATLLLFLRRRRDLVFKPVFVLFAAFIMACGATHILGTVTLWLPLYWLDGAVKALTAVLSVATAIALWPLMPKALALPSPELLREANEKLEREVAQGLDTTAKLRETKDRLRQLYARTPAAMHAVDADGVLLDVSDRWLDLVGYDRDEVIGRRIAEFYTPESAVKSDDHVAALRAGSLLLTAERRIVCRDGRIRDVEVNVDLDRAADGRLLRALCAVIDVTARKEAEAALRATEERLRHAQKMEAVGQLTGGIAHDFNNLLTTIMGSLELLQQRAALDERSGKLAANAMDGSRRAARLVSQLLSFSRRQILSPETLDVAGVVDGMHALLAQSLDADMVLQIHHIGAVGHALADRSQLEAALLNLVINARDAIREQSQLPDRRASGGTVTIAVASRSLTRASLAGADGYLYDSPDPPQGGDFVVITIEDTGNGMTAQVRARAVEPFFTTKPQGSGTGLGLSQVYGFASQSGGAIRLDSTPGAGTRIELLLPRAAEAVPAVAAAE